MKKINYRQGQRIEIGKTYYDIIDIGSQGLMLKSNKGESYKSFQVLELLCAKDAPYDNPFAGQETECSDMG